VTHFTPQSNASSSSERLDHLSKGRAMTIRFDCQFCGKTLKADDTKAGKKVKCPSCEGLLSIPDLPVSAESTLPEPEYLDDEIVEGSSKSAEIAKGKRTIPCPMCDEPISSRETTCPFCGEELKAKKKRRRYPLADLGKRFLGALADGFAGFLFVAPGVGLLVAAMGTMQEDSEPPPMFFVGILLAALGGLVCLAIQIYLLINRSQTIGKYLVKTQIMDYETDAPAGFVKTFLLRIVVNRMIGMVPCVGAIYPLVDVLFVFNEEHRCLHDQIAGTYVVDISES
jgi:uncharacterized RDD family membrane protein YckC/DNA-directed RNA polymerase subunit M/transcription elongation factor TFIIS